MVTDIKMKVGSMLSYEEFQILSRVTYFFHEPFA